MIIDEAYPGEGDFETYSEAGHIWEENGQKWVNLKGAGNKKKGLPTVGTAVYSEHPSTEVLSFAYTVPVYYDRALPPIRHPKLWTPGDPPPYEFFAYLAAGGLFEAHHALFEYSIWHNVAVPRLGWPPFPLNQMRDTAARARTNCLPGALEMLSDVLQLPTPKDERGKKILDLVSVPQKPTKKQPLRRITPAADPELFKGLYEYNLTDILAERGVAERTVPMSPAELLFWQIDQEINWRGIGIDIASVHNCLAVLEQAFDRYGDECRQLTGFNPTQLKELKGWLGANGVYMDTMDSDAVEEALERLPPHPPGIIYPARRVLEIRQLIGSAAVKKLYAMANTTSHDARLRNTMIHHGARTGRPTGDLVQPLNMVKAGPDLKWCRCGRPYNVAHLSCPWCGSAAPANQDCEWPAAPTKWKDGTPYIRAPGYDIGPDYILEMMAHRSLDIIEYYFGDAVLCIAGCSRSIFVAGPDNELIASDYSQIEAVVLACMAGEQWRIDAFRENKPMYLLSAAKITGRTLEFYEDYKRLNGHHHEDRQKIGKVFELACGYAGWIGSARAFGSTESDDWIKGKIVAWRDESPAIVEFWGGQFRGKPWDQKAPQEYFGVEGHFILAALYPGNVFEFRGLRFYTRDFEGTGRAVIIQLPSGRELTYHGVRLFQAAKTYSRPGEYAIAYMTYNSNTKYGPIGWVPMETYGGRLTENIIQAIAHDILRHAIINLRAIGYGTVLHIYDEILAEVRRGTANIDVFEAVMAAMPWWCSDWPIRAAGGWIGQRYRKG